ncbi:MAG: SDR family NAD(P)-dependent oxidoreductase [Pseudomonadota bacterium]
MAVQQANTSGFTRKSTAEDVTDGVDLAGKVILITGVASGLGKEAMRVLAKRGAHVIGLDRTLEAATAACAEAGGHTTPLACNLADPQSILACAKDIKAQFPAIDVVLTNAGIMCPPYTVVDNYKEPLEIQFAVNFLGHFVLINQLLEQIKAAKNARIALVASEGYATAPKKTGIQFEDLDFSEGYVPLNAYGHSKLAVMLLSKELAKRLDGSGVTANSIHPGVIKTNLASDTESIVVKMISLFAKPWLRTIAQGAATHCYVSAHPSIQGVTGKHFADSNTKEPQDHPLVNDMMLAGRLWDKAMDLAQDYIVVDDKVFRPVAAG